MYTDAGSGTATTVFLGFFSVVLFIVFFITFLRLAINVKSIKRKLNFGDSIAKAIILITQNRGSEAFEVIKEAFLHDCIRELDVNWFESEKCDSNVSILEHKYTRIFTKQYPEINKEVLHTEYLKVRKFYIEEN